MSVFTDVPPVTNDELSFIIKLITLLSRRFSIDLMIVLNIPRAPRSKGSPRHKNISDSFPKLSINVASVYVLSTCVLYTLPSDRRDIAVEFLIFFVIFPYIYVSIITDTNYVCIWGITYCKSVFVIILSSELYLNLDAIIFITALVGKEYSGKTNLFAS